MSTVPVIFSGTSARNQTLEQTPLRVLTFLYGLSNHPEIQKQLAPVGYTEQAHEQGWALLHACSGYGGMDLATSTTPAAAAIRELSDWCGRSFGRIQAALTHLHPEQEAYVFQGVAAITGPGAVVAVELLLERLDDLAGTGKNAAARAATAVADKQALATLAVRGFDDKELKRVHDLVGTAHSVAAPEASGAPTTMSRADALTALKAWYDDWATTSRDVIEKRSDLIKIGLAKPRKAKAGPADAPGAPVSPIATPVTPAAAPVPAQPAPISPPAAPLA